MKIICDNCRTKYSIADEKVKGKVFKIRCKKCSNIIVVRGNQQQDQQAEAQPADGAYAGGGDYGEAPAWHLVVDQKQVGPMTGAEVRDRFARAEIDADTYVWREGFADWMRLAQVEEFADIAQATQVAPPTAGAYEEQQPSYGAEGPQAWSADAGGQEAGWSGGEPAAPAAWSAPAEGGAAASWSAPEAEQPEGDNLFGGQMAEDPNRDLFASGHGQDAGPAYSGAAPEPASEGGLFGASGASASAAAGGGDLFGAPAAGGNGQQLFSQEEEPQPAQAQMTGARNENSVLFSLTNLQALAMGGKGPAPSAGPGPAGPSGGPSGGPSDGSGLIDIRVMASSPAPAPAASGEGLPDLGGFAAPIAAAPVLIPAAGEERPKWLLPALIGGGVILVGAITALVLVLVFREPEQVVVASAAPTGQQVGVQQPTAPTAPAPKEKTEPKPATSTEDTKAEKGDETKSASAAGRRRRHGRRRSGASRGRREPSAPAEPARSASRDKKPKKRDAIDDLIDGAIGGKKAGSGGSAAAARPKPRRTSDDSNLPETLTRAQIQGGMRGIKGKVQGCYDRYKVPGMANVQVRIKPSGSVGSARVVGMFAGTPTGACVQAAAKSARFSRFKGSPITITYPFILR